MASAFFEQEKTCPVCDKKFTTTRVRSSASVVVKRDTDFCIYYKDINPMHYSIMVCPHCHYAALDKNFSDNLETAEKLRLQKGLELLRKEESDMSKERKAELALRACELAIQAAQIKKSGPGLIGSLFLRASWFAREINNLELEKEYINQARLLYTESFEKERKVDSKMTEARLMYIIGELNRRSGLYQEAVLWFNKAVTNKNIKGEPEIERLSRDQWDMAKQQYKQQKEGFKDAEIIQIETAVPEKDATIKIDEKESQKKKNENPPTREKDKINISLYKDQIAWLNEIVKNNYHKTKVQFEPEIIISAILDTIKERVLNISDFKNEEQIKEKVNKILK